MSNSPDAGPAIDSAMSATAWTMAATCCAISISKSQRGETLVLLGRSGSGKTTTLKLINRLLTQSAGDIYVDGRSLDDWDIIRLRRRIGYVIQDVGLFPHFTVARNIGLVPQIEGLARRPHPEPGHGIAATGRP